MSIEQLERVLTLTNGIASLVAILVALHALRVSRSHPLKLRSAHFRHRKLSGSTSENADRTTVHLEIKNRRDYPVTINMVQGCEKYIYSVEKLDDWQQTLVPKDSEFGFYSGTKLEIAPKAFGYYQLETQLFPRDAKSADIQLFTSHGYLRARSKKVTNRPDMKVYRHPGPREFSNSWMASLYIRSQRLKARLKKDPQ